MTEIPHAPTYEKSILSTMLKAPDPYIAKARGEGITTEHFHVPAHKSIFERITSRPIEQIELVAFVTEMHLMSRR